MQHVVQSEDLLPVHRVIHNAVPADPMLDQLGQLRTRRAPRLEHNVWDRGCMHEAKESREPCRQGVPRDRTTLSYIMAISLVAFAACVSSRIRRLFKGA